MSSESVKYIYSEAQSKGADYITPILFVFVVGSIFGYLYTRAQNKILNLTWNNQKCNPRYLFFSGFLNSEGKTPWYTTEQNFNQCFEKSMYKDPSLSKEIKRSDQYIRLHDNEYRKNLATSKEAVEDIDDEYTKIKDTRLTQADIAKSDAGGIFEKQGYMHNVFTYETTKMFEVLKSTIFYIENLLLDRITRHKKELNMNVTHENFMRRYAAIYEKYNLAFTQLDNGQYSSAMNAARDAIEDYQMLEAELDALMEENFYRINEITESCYHLKYNLENNSCKSIYPHLITQWVDFYPDIKKILTGAGLV